MSPSTAELGPTVQTNSYFASPAASIVGSVVLITRPKLLVVVESCIMGRNSNNKLVALQENKYKVSLSKKILPCG